MHLRRILFVLVSVLALSRLLAAEEPPSLAEAFEPLRPFIGKTWKAPLQSSTAEKPVYDISKWERALNGQAVRVLHSINSGEYGGETIIVWNVITERLEFHYFTTAGFFTRGTIRFEEGAMVTHEVVLGNPNGVTQVRGRTEIRPDGRMETKSMFLKDGAWVEGHEATYEEAPDAEVVFK